MKIYCLPGLGFDDRLFRNIDFSGFDVSFINWIEPEKKETFQSYAKRISNLITETSEKIVLIGHSLGGMLSLEIATFKNVEKVILISSISKREHNPFHFKIVKPLFIHNLFTKELTLKTVRFWGKNHDYVTDEEQELFKSMVAKHSNQYLQWALKQVSIWRPPESFPDAEIVHIHGDRDNTFPIKKLGNVDFVIEDGGHFMTYKKATQIEGILKQIL